MKPTYKQVTKTRYIEQISQLAEEIFVQHYTKLTPKVARALAEKTPQSPALLRTTFIDRDGFLESLIGIYEAESLPFLEKALHQGRWSIWSALPREGNCLVPRPDSPAFLNMNTQEEFQWAVGYLTTRR